MREQIKNRPVNKKKLLKRTLTTALMAVLFGLVACLTFLLLEPLISNKLNPEEHLISEVTFPEEEIEDEKKFEDLIIDDAEISMETGQETPTIVQQRVGLEISDYSSLFGKMYFQASVCMKSVVKVSGVSKDTDWMSYSYDSTTITTGLIVADNTQQLLIVAPLTPIAKAEKIYVTFCNNVECEAVVTNKDENTGLAILAVELTELSELTKSQISYAEFANSNLASLTGSLIMAIGAPMGNFGSVGYGIVTGVGNPIVLEDVNYKYFTTDIYCSQSASGVVVDLKGKVLGIISQEYVSQDMKNQLSAIGISELKKTIEMMSNGDTIPRVGIYGQDVTSQIHNGYGVPYGAYVSRINMDSPAMTCGIQNGDVIVKINQNDIYTFQDYTNVLAAAKAGDIMNMKIMRYSGEEYKEMTISVTLSE